MSAFDYLLDYRSHTDLSQSNQNRINTQSLAENSARLSANTVRPNYPSSTVDQLKFGKSPRFLSQLKYKDLPTWFQPGKVSKAASALKKPINTAPLLRLQKIKTDHLMSQKNTNEGKAQAMSTAVHLDYQDSEGEKATAEADPGMHADQPNSQSGGLKFRRSVAKDEAPVTDNAINQNEENEVLNTSEIKPLSAMLDQLWAAKRLSILVATISAKKISNIFDGIDYHQTEQDKITWLERTHNTEKRKEYKNLERIIKTLENNIIKEKNSRNEYQELILRKSTVDFELFLYKLSEANQKSIDIVLSNTIYDIEKLVVESYDAWKKIYDIVIKPKDGTIKIELLEQLARKISVLPESKCIAAWVSLYETLKALEPDEQMEILDELILQMDALPEMD